MKSTVLVSLAAMMIFCACPSLLAQQQASASIIEAYLGTDVQSRMIVGADTTFALGSKVFIWLNVKGAASENITVTWRHGSTARETELAIGGDPWRTWAWKNVNLAGEWTVTVTGPGEIKLHEARFTVR